MCTSRPVSWEKSDQNSVSPEAVTNLINVACLVYKGAWELKIKIAIFFHFPYCWYMG